MDKGILACACSKQQGIFKYPVESAFRHGRKIGSVHCTASPTAHRLNVLLTLLQGLLTVDWCEPCLLDIANLVRSPSALPFHIGLVIEGVHEHVETNSGLGSRDFTSDVITHGGDTADVSGKTGDLP